MFALVLCISSHSWPLALRRSLKTVQCHHRLETRGEEIWGNHSVSSSCIPFIATATNAMIMCWYNPKLTKYDQLILSSSLNFLSEWLIAKTLDESWWVTTAYWMPHVHHQGQCQKGKSLSVRWPILYRQPREFWNVEWTLDNNSNIQWTNTSRSTCLLIDWSLPYRLPWCFLLVALHQLWVLHLTDSDITSFFFAFHSSVFSLQASGEQTSTSCLPIT